MSDTTQPAHLDNPLENHLEVVASPDGSPPQVRFSVQGSKEAVMDVLSSLAAATRRGRKPGRKNLTLDAVRDIRQWAAAGEDHDELASEYGLCRLSVANIVARRTWAGLDS
jgi:hypothetical protein